MVVLVPNYQARISRVDHSVASLTIDVEARHVPPENLELKLYARADDVIQDHVDLANAKLPYRRQFPVRPAEWNVVLARKNDGTVIDYRHSYGVEKPTKVDLASLDSHRLTVIVAAGENTYREFKPFPYDDNGKRDVAETAVAFANTQGGVIFIGVRDDSTIEGVDRDGLEDTLVSSIRDRTDPPVEVTVHRVPVTGKFVYLVLVTPSTSRPHFLLKENVAYVRAASTDRRATRSEVYDMFRSERRGGLPGDLPWARST
jgi:hypothetical protein